MKTAILVDGNNLASRARHAFTLSDSQGQNTQVIFGVLKSLQYFLKDYSPHKILIFWDAGRAQWRRNLFPEYKASRTAHAESPEEKHSYEQYIRQLGVVQELMRYHPLHSFRIQGNEADDLISYVTLFGSSLQGWKKIIISMDEDFFQLISSEVQVYSPSKECLVDLKWLQENYGVTPRQHLIMKAFTGDSSDEIPGFPQIGPKTALKIMQRMNMSENIKDYLSPEAISIYREKNKTSILASLESISELKRNYCMMNLQYGAVVLEQSDSIKSILTEEISKTPSLDKKVLWNKLVEADMRSFAAKFMDYCSPWESLVQRQSS